MLNPEADVSKSIRELVSVIVPENTPALAGAGGEKRRRRGIFGR
jgi:hypothetical protein